MNKLFLMFPLLMVGACVVPNEACDEPEIERCLDTWAVATEQRSGDFTDKPIVCPGDTVQFTFYGDTDRIEDSYWYYDGNDPYAGFLRTRGVTRTLFITTIGRETTYRVQGLVGDFKGNQECEPIRIKIRTSWRACYDGEIEVEEDITNPE